MSETLEQVAAEANQLQLQYAKRYRAFVQEALMDFTDSYSSARQGYLDDDGERWTPIGGAGSSTSQYRQWTYGFADESQLFLAQAECRNLVFSNEFAINGHENRISYIVGAGHTYSVAAKKDVEVGDTLVQAAQAWFDEFLRLNRWQCRQQEILKRRDRDGEVFIRLFFDADGTTRVRFVEPEDVQQPVVKTKQNTFGIETDPDDVETVLGYYVGETNQFVDAREIQHRKANVDTNCKRGVPLFYPVRKNLRRAEKLLRNMSTVAGVQAAIAFIRKHASASSGAVSSWVSGRADVSVSDSTTGQVSNFSNYGPGTVLDSPSSIEYEFPSAGLDAAKYVQVLQAELRAIASRLVMPEFMLTSDASNANYSSTMVAEGPAVKKFAREQCELIEYDQDIFMRAMQHAVDSGKLPAESVELLTIQAEGPTLAVRDKLQEAQTDQIYVNLRCKSRQNIAQEQGWDYEQEQQNIESDREDYGQQDTTNSSPAKLALANDPVYTQSAKEQAMEAVAAHWGKDFGSLTETTDAGRWVTIRGVHVLIGSDGKIEKGPKDLVGKNPDELDDNASKNTGKKKTDTPEFKAWFGDSKVVDENGKPMVVYHGTNDKFYSFDPGKVGSANSLPADAVGFYFSNDVEIAKQYLPKRDGNIVDAYLSIKNPYTEDFGGSGYIGQLKDGTNVADFAKSHPEHDGIILKNVIDTGKEPSNVFIAMNPNQIKSATGNKGTFSNHSNDIREQRTETDD